LKARRVGIGGKVLAVSVIAVLATVVVQGRDGLVDFAIQLHIVPDLLGYIAAWQSVQLLRSRDWLHLLPYTTPFGKEAVLEALPAELSAYLYEQPQEISYIQHDEH
jgi:hypothetical protein